MSLLQKPKLLRKDAKDFFIEYFLLCALPGTDRAPRAAFAQGKWQVWRLCEKPFCNEV